jgi:hypothetical protein
MCKIDRSDGKIFVRYGEDFFSLESFCRDLKRGWYPVPIRSRKKTRSGHSRREKETER